MIERVRGEVDGCANVGEIVRLALRRTELSCVREEVVSYQRCA